MTNDEIDKLEGLVKKTARDLSEHFDSVRIMVTAVDDGKTYCFNEGPGTCSPRLGSVGIGLLLTGLKWKWKLNLGKAKNKKE
jgi:hypothetical protein